MIKFGLLLAGFAVMCFADQNNVKLEGDSWKWVMENFSGFNLWRRNETFTITTDSDSTIKIFCKEISITVKKGNTCPEGKLTFNDGVSSTTYCGSHENVLILGKSSKMVADYVIPQSSGGVFYCEGKAVHPPRSYETITVKPGASIKVDYPKTSEKDDDKAFSFSSTTGSKITLKCTTKLDKPLRTGQCAKEILTIDAGNGPQESCGKGQVSATGTTIKMRVETLRATKGTVSCVVKG